MQGNSFLFVECYYNSVGIYFCFQGKMYICNVLFRIDFRFGEITDEKESGESPGQSRCCKLQTFTFVYPLQGHCLLNEDGKARQTGVSQKTCKTKSCLHSRGKDGKNVRNVELQLKFE